MEIIPILVTYWLPLYPWYRFRNFTHICFFYLVFKKILTDQTLPGEYHYTHVTDKESHTTSCSLCSQTSKVDKREARETYTIGIVIHPNTVGSVECSAVQFAMSHNARCIQATREQILLNL